MFATGGGAEDVLTTAGYVIWNSDDGPDRLKLRTESFGMIRVGPNIDGFEPAWRWTELETSEWIIREETTELGRWGLVARPRDGGDAQPILYGSYLSGWADPYVFPTLWNAATPRLAIIDLSDDFSVRLLDERPPEHSEAAGWRSYAPYVFAGSIHYQLSDDEIFAQTLQCPEP